MALLTFIPCRNCSKNCGSGAGLPWSSVAAVSSEAWVLAPGAAASPVGTALLPVAD